MIERGERKRELEREVYGEREREYIQGDTVLRVRRGGRRRGSRVAQRPQTQGSRPAFKQGHEENADAVSYTHLTLPTIYSV